MYEESASYSLEMPLLISASSRTQPGPQSDTSSYVGHYSQLVSQSVSIVGMQGRYTDFILAILYYTILAQNIELLGQLNIVDKAESKEYCLVRVLCEYMFINLYISLAS